MSTRGSADVVFCIDASASMQPCIDAVRAHVVDFIRGLESGGQVRWDLRFDFVAHRAGEHSRGTVFDHSSIRHASLREAVYVSTQSGSDLFTSDVDEFQGSLNDIEASGDEASLVALDFCLDFPWRARANCHRVVIMLTDEPLETGVYVAEQTAKIPDLVKKIQDLGVMLFLVGPQSTAFDRLAEADRSEYEVIDDEGDGLARVDFRRVLEHVGKSVSVSTLQDSGEKRVNRALFDQTDWGTTAAKITGR